MKIKLPHLKLRSNAEIKSFETSRPDFWLSVLKGNKLFLFIQLLFLIQGLSSAVMAATITSTGTGGAWTTGGTWVGGSAPAVTDDVIIAGGATVTLGGNRTCISMTVNNTGTLTMANNNLTLTGGGITINGTVTMGNGNLNLTGDFTNSGTFTAGTGRVVFNGNNILQTISGATTFNNITVNKGTSVNNILNVSSVISMASDGLTITNGTFKLSSASTITPITGATTLTANAGLWNNGGTISITGGDLIFSGLFRNSSGTTTIGSASGHELRYATGSTVTIEGGSVNIAASLRPDNSGTSTTTYNQSGGTFTCGTIAVTSGSTGVFDISQAGSSFTMSAGTIVIVRANGSFAGADYLVLASTSSVSGGTVQIGNGSTPAAQTIDINSTVPVFDFTVNTTNSPIARLLTNAITVQNDLSIATGATLNTNNLNISVSDDWTNSGTFTPGTTVVTFNSNDDQIITGTNSFYRVTVNKSGGSLTLSNSITITNSLTLTRGFVFGSATNQIILNDNVTVTGASDSSHIDGAVKKIGNEAFTFPLGNGNFYTPISISAPTNTNQEFTAQYFSTPYVNTTTLSGLTNVSVLEHWILDRSGNTDNVNVTLSFSSTRGSTVNTAALADLRVARWDGAQWVSHGNGGTSFSSPNGTIVTSAVVSSFSPFTLGSLNGLSALPVNWIDFKAKALEKTVLLDWTVSESAYTDFLIEKSANGKDWFEIGSLNGNANTNTPVNFNFFDISPVKGLQYYRIKQSDLNGVSSYSVIVPVYYDQLAPSSINIYPNPFINSLNVSLQSDEPFSVVVYNTNGQKEIEIFNDSGNTATLDISNLSLGLHLVEILQNDRIVSTRKIIKE